MLQLRNKRCQEGTDVPHREPTHHAAIAALKQRLLETDLKGLVVQADAATVGLAELPQRVAAVVVATLCAALQMMAGAATWEAARQNAGERKAQMVVAEAQEATVAMEASRGSPLVAGPAFSQLIEMSISFPSTLRLTMVDACPMDGCFRDVLRVERSTVQDAARAAHSSEAYGKTTKARIVTGHRSKIHRAASRSLAAMNLRIPRHTRPTSRLTTTLLKANFKSQTKSVLQPSFAV